MSLSYYQKKKTNIIKADFYLNKRLIGANLIHYNLVKSSIAIDNFSKHLNDYISKIDNVVKDFRREVEDKLWGKYKNKDITSINVLKEEALEYNDFIKLSVNIKDEFKKRLKIP